ncbi:hypothetical protein [Myxococcus xanthus]|uniref:hypothetical protein n=1 Tax=Myxococcus xanthus TaxID=34 RepID=UPI001CEC2AA7|nr:hypothetical protein [Myxococcus xanthus]
MKILNTAMVLLGTTSVMVGCNFDQPKTDCFVQESDLWMAKYDLVGTPTHASGGSCEDVAPIGELIGVFKFVNPDDGTGQLAIRPDGLAALAVDDETTSQDEQTALGQLNLEPDEQDFCDASGFSTARVFAADAAGGAANEIIYEFSNVRVYSAPSAPGTQLTGELKYTNNGCTSTYVVRALWPAVGCDPEAAVPARNCGAGSGLNPDFATTCAVGANCYEAHEDDELTGCCVPAGDIPSFK